MRRLIIVRVLLTFSAAMLDARQGVATTFTNAGSITINDYAAATPYPSSILVSGLGGSIGDVNVSLNGLSHPYPSDISILLVGPSSQRLLLMSHCGDAYSASSLNLTFDDSAPSLMPVSAPLQSGSFRPSQYFTVPTFPAPAPAGPYGTTLSVFDGSNPNGTWSLFVIDTAFLHVGLISGGWSLDLATVPEPSSLVLFGPALMIWLVRVRGRTCRGQERLF